MQPRTDADRSVEPDKKQTVPASDPVEAPPKTRRETERELDHGLKETFPASDPVSINPGAD
jgi:hypothetical protein